MVRLKVVGKALGISDGATVHNNKNNYSNSNVSPLDSKVIKFNSMLSAFGSSLIAKPTVQSPLKITLFPDNDS